MSAPGSFSEVAARNREVCFAPRADILSQIDHVRKVPEADINASFDHLTRTAKQRERDDNAQRLGWLLRPLMIMANSKEALPPDFTGVKAPAKHF
jgi:hypothetical protein